jgi:hypothetical protein
MGRPGRSFATTARCRGSSPATKRNNKQGLELCSGAGRNAPIRTGLCKAASSHPLRGGFSFGGVAVSLGRLAVLTALCESDPMNEDSVANWVAERKGPDGSPAAISLLRTKRRLAGSPWSNWNSRSSCCAKQAMNWNRPIYLWAGWREGLDLRAPAVFRLARDFGAPGPSDTCLTKVPPEESFDRGSESPTQFRATGATIHRNMFS